MPRIEDIEKFTQVLNSLGDEPALRAARSETIEQVAPPGEESMQPEGEPLDSLPSEEEAFPGVQPGAEPSTVEQEGLQDIFEGLSELSEEPGGDSLTEAQTPEEPTVGEPAVSEADGISDGLDFASLFAEESEPNAIEELETPAPQEPAGASQLPEEDAFTFPEGEPAGLQSDISQMEIVPEDTGPFPEPARADEPAVPEAGAESIEDFGSFSLDTPETTQEEGAPQMEPAGEPGESIDLPDLDELSFGEPSAEPAPSNEPSFDMPEPDAPSGIPAAGGFDLDTATGFEIPEPEPGAEPLETQPPAFEPSGEAAKGEEPGMESLGEESLGDLNLDELNIRESAEQFAAPALQPVAPPPARVRAAPGRPAPARPAPKPRRPAPPSAAPQELAGAAEEIELTPEQFARLKKSLEALPRNLKVAVQDLIGDGKAAGADLSKLISLLLGGASAQEIATLAGRISGKRIRIPAGYEKKTGVAFEAEQRTFAYAFRENILPLLRVVVLTVLVGGLLGFFGYSYVYKPLYASTNYRAGYAQIANNRFTLANERFARAVGVWPMKSWFYRYAEAFADKRQYVLAEEKYDDLLRRFRDDRKGILDYARMESARLADYEKADALLKRILDNNMYDYDAVLAAGDNDMEWGEKLPAKLEAARFSYATLIEKYGVKEDLLFRMLRFFIRTDNGEEVERLRLYYASRPEVKINAEVFAELGGYLVDHRRLEHAQDVLFRADKVKPGLAEVHYNLARYYRIVQRPADEKKALDAVVQRMKITDALTTKRLSMEIDTFTRRGEYNYTIKEYIASEKDLQTAITLVEQNQRMKLIGKDKLFGRPYAALGDIYYYIQGDFVSAGAQYQNAIANQFTDPELSYKIGYIQYAGRDYKGALASFASTEDQSAYPSGNEALAPAAPGESGVAVGGVPAAPSPTSVRVPVNLLFALGDSFFQRGDFFAAQGYFLGLLDRLETKKAAIGALRPLELPEHRALLDTLVKVNNNLGVTMIKLSERTGDRKKRSEALVYLTTASQIADSLSRAPDSVQRNENRNLPSLNMKGILYPVPDFVLQIFQGLPRDLQAQSW